MDGREKDRHIFLRQNNFRWKRPWSSFKQMERAGKFGETGPLVVILKVDPCFRQSIMRTAKDHVLDFPEREKSRIDLVGCGKQNVGIKKQPIHLFRSQMWNRIGVEAQPSNLFPGLTVIGVIDSIG